MAPGDLVAELKREEGRGEFPVGMKVLVVDDDMTTLTILKRMLEECKYDATTCSQATGALAMLREKPGGFDVILSDVHMPDMDGFKLLELVGLEMDLPVIMMSADSRTEIVMKGIKHGACDYLIKPVRMEELKNIWQHVVRKRWNDNKELELELSGSLDLEDSDRIRQAPNETENTSSVNDGADGNWKSLKKKRDIKEEEEGDNENADAAATKKPRVVWSLELHQQFVNAVNHLGIDKAVPKKILELMNVPGLTRENVASHLQKFRLYLKRIAQHHAGLPGPFGPAANMNVGSLGPLELQALAASGQVSSAALAAMHDELLGIAPSSIALPARDQSSMRLASAKGKKNAPGELEIAFGQPLLKSQANGYRPFNQCSAPVGVMPSFPAWPGNRLAVADSTSNLAGLNNSQNNNMLLPVFQTQQAEPVLRVPAQPLNTFQTGQSQVFPNQNALAAMPSQSSTGFLAGIRPPVNQESVLTAPQLSSSLFSGTNLLNQGTNQSLISAQGGNVPARVYHTSNVVPSQTMNSFQTTNALLLNQNPAVASPRPANGMQAESNPSYGYISSASSMDPSLLSSQSRNIQFGLSQDTDERSISWPLQGADIYGGGHNGRLAPASCNFQGSGTAIRAAPDEVRGRNLGFVGKGNCIPSRFMADDIESPTNNLSHSISSAADSVNSDVFGFTGQ